MQRCPICNSEMIIEDTHLIKVKYKIVDGRRGKYPVIEKYNESNRIGSKKICQNCSYSTETM